MRSGLLAALFAFIVPVFAADAAAPRGNISLFNGRDLSGWTAVAKDNDPAVKTTWSVVDGILHCSGTPKGYLRTTKSYRDYRLTLQWRWVPAPPPVDEKGNPQRRNSGAMVHIQGEDTVWPKCMECQMFERQAGELWVIGIDTAELAAYREKTANSAKDQAARDKARKARHIPLEKPSENPFGEWNSYEIICRGNIIETRVNGVLQARATAVTVAEGFIGLQSEGAPVEFRNLELQPLP